MRSIGFGGSGHDWSCCLVDSSGRIVSVEEALLTRRKYGLGADLLQSRAREACLREEALAPSDIDFAVACDLVPLPLVAPFRRRVVRIRHHLAHAYGAFFCSPFERAAILITDNSGSPLHERVGQAGFEREVETLSYGYGQGQEIRLLDGISGRHVLEVGRPVHYYQPGETDNSLGHLYGTVSEEIGFAFRQGDGPGVTEDGKTMALAAFGDDRYERELGGFMSLQEEGQIRLRLADGEFRSTLRALLAAGSPSQEERWARRAAMARAAQCMLERALLHAGSYLRRRTGERFLAMAGGVALNCVANSRVAREVGFDNIFVLPAPGDDGNALGSALYGLVQLGGQARPLGLYERLPFLGPQHSRESCEEAVRFALERGASLRTAKDPVALAAAELARSKVVAWFEGRSEFGPRALGHRSILADPRDSAMRDRVNAAVKRREVFRPFAPIVLEHRALDFFDIPQASAASLPFMLAVGHAHEARRAELGAILHVDGTARIQTVSAERYPTLHRLLLQFEERTGIPVLLNTSFNIAGEPIVESPLDAVHCFLQSDIDLLVLEGQVLVKPAT